MPLPQRLANPKALIARCCANPISESGAVSSCAGCRLRVDLFQRNPHSPRAQSENIVLAVGRVLRVSPDFFEGRARNAQGLVAPRVAKQRAANSRAEFIRAHSRTAVAEAQREVMQRVRMLQNGFAQRINRVFVRTRVRMDKPQKVRRCFFRRLVHLRGATGFFARHPRDIRRGGEGGGKFGRRCFAGGQRNPPILRRRRKVRQQARPFGLAGGKRNNHGKRTGGGHRIQQGEV